MNVQQRLWWEQTQSDYRTLLILRRRDADPCQQLHYVQMVTEKLGKAYFWRTGRPPRRTHASFVKFLVPLDNRSGAEVSRIAEILGFGRRENFAEWIRSAAPLAYDIERLSPSLAGDAGPNCEYPWPRLSPLHAPANHPFPVWSRLTETGSGKQFLRVLDRAVMEFPQYA